MREFGLEELPQGERREIVVRVGGGGGGMRLLWAGAKGFRARRDAAGRAPGDCSAWAEAPGDCSERETGEFRLDELPQGECREIVLRGEGGRGGGRILL